MYWTNTMIAGWLSMMMYAVPEPDYFEIWMAEAMRSKCLPAIPGH